MRLYVGAPPSINPRRALGIVAASPRIPLYSRCVCVTSVSAHDPTPLATLLTATPTCGTSALVVGATARRRLAFLAELRLALRERSPAWLVAQLPAPTAARGCFEDRLDGALDEALGAAGAPEALRGDASLTARVGAWLFRARAVGLEGIVLILEEIDRWLDGRSGPTARDALLALLAQGRRAPWSVVASVRASSAAGSAALPQEVVTAFEEVCALGPAVATVTRDPMALAASLAGRSFYRTGLLAAVEAWLALPTPSLDHDVDDIAIVFSSPLGAPVLPVPTGPGPAHAAPPPAPPVPPMGQRAPEALEPAHGTEGLRAAVTLASALARLRRASVGDVPSAERVFREDLLPVPLAVARVVRAAQATGAQVTHLTAAAHQALTRFDQAFAPVRDAVAQGTDACRVDTLGRALSTHAARVGARSTALVWLPGLRADLWERFVTRVLSRVPGLQRTGDEGLAWSLGPPESSPEARTIDVYAASLGEGFSLPAVEAAEAATPAALAAVASAFAGRTAVLFAGHGTGASTVFDTLVPWGLFTFDPFGGSPQP